MSQITPLLQVLRPSVVGRYLGQLSLAWAGLALVPVCVALFSGDDLFALRLLLAVVLPAGLLGLLARLPTPASPIQTNEALAVIALSFIEVPLLMVYPLHGAGLTPVDALFEAVSGVTTTGLSSAGSLAGRDSAFLFARAWLQWCGGLGMVVLSLALFGGAAAEGRRLADPAWEEEDLAGSTRAHARRVLAVYAVLTMAGVSTLWLLGLEPFGALLHTLSAISTGGFANSDASLAGWSRETQTAVMAVAICGALPLPLFHRLWRRGWRELVHDLELRALLAALAISAGLLMLVSNLATADALLQAASAQTGTGFASVEIAALPAADKLVLIGSMLGGAGLGSTAGGIKLLRVLILLRIAQLAVLRISLPRHAVAEPSLNGHRLAPAQVEKAMVTLLLFIGLIGASWLPFLVTGYDPLDALFEVVSAVATVGLSTGISAPELSDGLKLLLCLDMLAGRLEIIALLVLLYPGNWWRPGNHGH